MEYCIMTSNKRFFFEVEKDCNFVLSVDKSEENAPSYLRIFKTGFPSDPTTNIVYVEFDGGADMQVIYDRIIITVDNIGVASYLEERLIKSGIEVKGGNCIQV